MERVKKFAEFGLSEARAERSDPTYSQSLRLRVLLLAGVAVSALAGLAWGAAVSSPPADADLAFLLRGMALIKAGLVLLGLGLLLWRFGRPLPAAPAVASYFIGAWLAALASALIWQLAYLGLAATAFHAGELLLLITAWRDHGSPLGATAKT